MPSASADSKSTSASNCEEDSIHEGSVIKFEDKKNLVNGANADEELSTLALIRGDSSRDRMQIESSSACEEFTNDVYEDDEKWRQPWSEEELEHLAITMEDYEVSFLEHAPTLSVVTGFALLHLFHGGSFFI